MLLGGTNYGVEKAMTQDKENGQNHVELVMRVSGCTNLQDCDETTGSHHPSLRIVETCQSYKRNTYKKNDSHVNYLPTAIEKEDVMTELCKTKN